MAAVRGFLWVALSTMILPGLARADEDRAIAAYSDGVHAYFNGNLEAAHEYLTSAIDEATPDPRPYFFRGIVRGLLGQTDLAREDYQAGAEAELTPKGESFDVNDALERVQGKTRMEIEEVRRVALANAKKLAEQSSRNGRRVRGDQKIAPFDPNKLPDVSEIVDATVPFAEINANPYFPPVKTADEIVPANLPTIAPNMPAASGPPVNPADDPFNTGNSGNEKQPPPEMPKQDPPDAGDDPFDSNDGGDAPPSDQPAGDTPPPAEEEKAPESADDDPFGGG